MTINPIISDEFDDPKIPTAIKEIIERFLETEDGTYSEESKDKIYDQILETFLKKMKENDEKNKQEKLDEMIKWCQEFNENGWKKSPNT